MKNRSSLIRLHWNSANLKQGAHIHQPTAGPLSHACAQPYHAGSDSYRLKQGTHIHQPTAWSLPHTCARHITRAVAHEQLFRPYWGSSAWHSRRSVTGQKPYVKETDPVEASPLPASSTQHMCELLAGNRTAVLPRHAQARRIMGLVYVCSLL